MGSDFDEAGFKKARGFLMAFSTLIFVLYYFSVDLNSISILGNSILFTENREKAWMALSIANAYLFFRYIQQFPDEKWRPDEKMQGVFQEVLVFLCRKVYHRKLLKAVTDSRLGATDRVVSIDTSGYLESYNDGVAVSAEKAALCKITISITYTIDHGTDVLGNGSGINETITPHRSLVRLSRILAFVKGVALKPWFLEHVFPIVYSIIVTGLALLKWWQMNQALRYAFRSSFNQLLVPL